MRPNYSFGVVIIIYTRCVCRGIPADHWSVRKTTIGFCTV